MALFLAYRAGDRDAFAKILVDRIRPRILEHVRHKWPRLAHDAPDVAGEIMLRLLRWFDRRPVLPATEAALVAFCLAATNHLANELHRRHDRLALSLVSLQDLGDQAAIRPQLPTREPVAAALAVLAEVLSRLDTEQSTQIKPRLRHHFGAMLELVARLGALPSACDIEKELRIPRRTASRLCKDFTGLIAAMVQKDKR
ncbi:MAG: hypothetical protein IT458_14710 [Planctomycetes bacterium]|nr:hypothetical protein [Planctomycetota bacterium]